MSLQKSANREFYSRHSVFRRFEDFCSDLPYTEVPDDWWVVVADIKGSTKAIQEGRYRDVNMAGASAIAAILNITGEVQIPYVFGGDGATFLLPPELVAEAKTALLRTQRFVHGMYLLDIRIGFVSVHSVHAQDARIQVAKYELSPGNNIAFFRGGGLSLADQFIKKGGPSGENYLIHDDGSDHELPNLEGLSCRWNPLEAKNGVVISLLVMAADLKGAAVTYTQIVEGLQKLLNLNAKENAPVGESHFRPTWPPHSWRVESALRKTRWLTFALTTILVHLAMIFEFPLGRFRPKKYKAEMAINSDFRKFDDMMRMVLDCSEAQAAQVESFLAAEHAKGRIFYGVHRSRQALMTCLVSSFTDNQHVHFIDGSDGGYAMAAAQLKAQMRKI